jgi:hypothetical protein
MRYLVYIFILPSTSIAYANENVLLAILGEPQCVDHAPLVIRPLFVKNQNKWESLSTSELAATYLPKSTHWIASMDNKRIGDLLSIEREEPLEPAWTYARDYWQVMAPNQKLPSILNTNKSFAGWCEAPLHRPIALVSIAHLSNPEQWKKSALPVKITQSLLSDFKKTFNRSQLCTNQAKQQPYRFNPKDIVITSQLVASNGDQLVAIAFKNDVGECVSELDSFTSPRWFFVENQTTHYIGTNLELIDDADYDNNGMTEFLFWYSGYNKDGYVLYSNHFQHHTDFYWHYH